MTQTEIWSSIFINSVNLLMYPIFLLIFYLWTNFLSNAIIYIAPIIYKSLMKYSCPKNWNWAVLVFGVPGSCNDSEKINELLLSSFLLLQVFSI